MAQTEKSERRQKSKTDCLVCVCDYLTEGGGANTFPRYISDNFPLDGTRKSLRWVKAIREHQIIVTFVTVPLNVRVWCVCESERSVGQCDSVLVCEKVLRVFFFF